MRSILAFLPVVFLCASAHAVISRAQADELKVMCLESKVSPPTTEQRPRFCECFAENLRYLVPTEFYGYLKQDWEGTLPSQFEDQEFMVLVNNLESTVQEACMADPNYFSEKAQRERDRLEGRVKPE